ncbi:MAG: hypothetical protein K6F95_00280 [Selenomonas sp.]|uniref:hypothetical protein n=1 Tax=Selenomonas sp. TaxID=2053611 RepID=UPI0025E089A5|nr:hypothetical protein [Selenomonas sp.]MCR5756334.1 hypothetical protein [Selenomonas sp.]
MDSFWVIVLFILFAVFSDRKDKKKPVPKRRIPDGETNPFPDRQNSSKNKREKIEIPELRGAPPLPEIRTSSRVQDHDAILPEQARYQEMLRKRMKKQQREQESSPVISVETALPQGVANVNNLQQAVIWTEILGKPKAYRRR